MLIAENIDREIGLAGPYAGNPSAQQIIELLFLRDSQLRNGWEITASHALGSNRAWTKNDKGSNKRDSPHHNLLLTSAQLEAGLLGTNRITLAKSRIAASVRASPIGD